MTISYVLCGLGLLVVVLTRVRLGGRNHGGAGRLSIPKAVLNAHTVAGVIGLGFAVATLATGEETLGVVAAPFLWVTVAVGLLILLRWMPARGRHSSGPVADSWGEGPGLSILAHVGMLVGVGLMTVFFVLDQIP